MDNQGDIEIQLARRFAELKQEKDDLEIRTKSVNEELEKTESKLMEILDAENKESVTYAGIGMITCVKPRVAASIVDDEILFKSLDAMGRGDLVKRKVNMQSLSLLVKEQIESSQPVPDGCSYIFIRKLRYTKK